jgi:hypothetical protein
MRQAAPAPHIGILLDLPASAAEQAKKLYSSIELDLTLAKFQTDVVELAAKLGAGEQVIEYHEKLRDKLITKAETMKVMLQQSNLKVRCDQIDAMYKQVRHAARNQHRMRLELHDRRRWRC